ncbi:MAG: GntR family transcriptional regulator [Lachnospiraceae bacterium]|nr:GntR family transcriptional regulator [Lachnospiraceae bacterium]
MKKIPMTDDNSVSLRISVFNALKNAIMRGELKPGERLMETHLADRLDVSRTPVREAIRMLDKEGLVVMVPRKGAHVAAMTEKDLTDVIEVREAIEKLAIELTSRRITDTGIKQLERAEAKFEKALKSNDYNEMAEADAAFHDVIFKATGNPCLMEILNNLSTRTYRYRLQYISDNSVHEKLIKEHKDIVTSLKKHDAKKALESMTEHIENQKQAVAEMIARGD